jgi:hypothetical protein
MSRIEFDGKGEPIPTIALPPFGGDSALPPTVFTFTENTEFLVEQYRELGFTHFDVWCVGGAGGRGGGVLTYDPYDHSYADVFLPSTSYGGEGGGGGLHRVAGLLEDLPDSVPIVVGKRGNDGVNGNRQFLWRTAVAVQDFAGVPTLLAVIRGATNIPGMVDGAGNAIPPYFWFDHPVTPNLSSSYLYYPNPTYVAPQDAADGTASSFGTICQASGGTGGKKSPVYYLGRDNNYNVSSAMAQAPGGAGGEGGIGGRTLVGGGGAGGKTSDLAWVPPGNPNYGQPMPWITTEAKDGTWDGVIGQGGGGGHGGTGYQPPDDPRFPTRPPPIIRTASKGGRGSFSYGDTSVYGQAGYYSAQIIPGTGGGARPSKNLKVGARTSGYSPDGIVVVRLTRIV